IVLQNDLSNLDQIVGQQIDGILGGDFLKGLIIEINFKKFKLSFHHPDFYKIEPEYTQLDLTIKNFKPYLKTTTTVQNKTDTLLYLLDTGASIGLLIHSNKNDFTLPKNAIAGALGKGLGGELTGYIGYINRLKIGPYAIKNIITNFQEIDTAYIDNKNIIRDGIIGNLLLSRFIIVIDYVKEKCYLKPLKTLNDKFDYDKSGLIIYASGSNFKDFYVKSVIPKSPASIAGIESGDKIIKIGFFPATWCTLQEILSKLQGKDGKLIKIKILRNEVEIKFQFRLKNLLEINQ
ncbi:MAG: PDZ domain-containing protein, partial [Saprospiraceae bacterium]